MTDLAVTVQNVGGIDATERSFRDPLAVIMGRNSSNKTSLLQAIAFGLGRSTVPIKNDAEEARVELELDGKRVVRTARRTPNGTEIEGDGWLSAGDVDVFEQFACLLEFSPVREAVRNDEDFGAVLKAPADLDALERERAEKLQRKRSLQTDLDALDDLDERRRNHEDELAVARERVADLSERLDERRSEQSAATADDDLADLREERADLVHRRNETETQLTDLQSALDRIDDRIGEVEDDLEAAREERAGHAVADLRAERREIEEDMEELTDRIEVLQSVLTANREMLASPHEGALGRESGLMGDTVVCWACGNEAADSDFEGTIADLAELVEADKERQREHEPRLEEIDAAIEAAEAADRRVEDLEAEKRDLESRRESRTESLETKRENLEAIRDKLASLDATVADRETEQRSTVSDLADEIESVRVDLHTARGEVDRLESAIADLDERARERDERRERVRTLSTEITALTERIESLEDRLREAFNESIADLIDVLGYEHIERVRLDGDFDLVVAREEDGVIQRDGVQNLSESEREMVGLVLALAGYVAYDVAEVAPVLLIDTLGSFDADRTAALLEYLADEAPLLVAALLPDSADALAATGVDHETIEPALAVSS